MNALSQAYVPPAPGAAPPHPGGVALQTADGRQITITADQLAELAARLGGKRTERPSELELAAMTPDQKEDALRSFYLNDHEGDDDWYHRRAQQFCIRDHEGRYYPWNKFQAADPVNEERPIAEFHDDALRQRHAQIQAEVEADAQQKADLAAAEERAVQARVEDLQRAQRIEEEAARRFQEAQGQRVAQQPQPVAQDAPGAVNPVTGEPVPADPPNPQVAAAVADAVRPKRGGKGQPKGG